MTVKLGWRLPHDANAAAAARHCLEGLRELVDRAVYQDLQLLVSELVTNSVRHAGRAGGERWIDLSLRAAPNCIHVEVADPGPGFDPSHAEPRADLQGGWGLYLVDRVASRWGVVPKPGKTTVWFEIEDEFRPIVRQGETAVTGSLSTTGRNRG